MCWDRQVRGVSVLGQAGEGVSVLGQAGEGVSVVRG